MQSTFIKTIIRPYELSYVVNKILIREIRFIIHNTKHYGMASDQAVLDRHQTQVKHIRGLPNIQSNLTNLAYFRSRHVLCFIKYSIGDFFRLLLFHRERSLKVFLQIVKEFKQHGMGSRKKVFFYWPGHWEWGGGVKAGPLRIFFEARKKFPKMWPLSSRGRGV